MPPVQLPVEEGANEEPLGRPDDQTAQRQLIYDMRYEIDRAGPTPTQAALGRVATLIYHNQRGAHAKYVLQGLSKNRIAFLIRHKLIYFGPHDLEWLMREDLL